MTLFSVISYLLIEWFWPEGRRFRCFEWLYRYFNIANQRLSDVLPATPYLAVGLVFLPFIVLFAILQSIFFDGGLAIFGYAISVAVLWYCLDSKEDLFAAIATYQNASDNNNTTLSNTAAETIIGDTLPKDVKHIPHAVMQAIFVKANQRFFAVLFWFIVLGPLGAVLYRGLIALNQHIEQHYDAFGKWHIAAQRCWQVLDWLPARLTALTYVLVGDFVSGFAQWLENTYKCLDNNESLVANTGQAALKLTAIEDGINAEASNTALGLVKRSMVVWVIIFTLFTLGSWLY